MKKDELPPHYPKREDIPWTDDELRMLYKAWLAVHVRRFDNGGKDYIGVLRAEDAIRELAGITLGYSYGWLPDVVGHRNAR